MSVGWDYRVRLVFLLLSPTFGMHQYTADLANRLANKEDVLLVTTKDYPQDRYSPNVTTATPISMSNTGLSFQGLRARALYQIKRTLEQLKPEVVHITGPHLWNPLLIHWLRQSHIPVIHTLHDLDPHKGTRYGRLLNIWNNVVIRLSDKIVVHGDIYRKRLIERGASPNAIVTFPLLHLFMGFEACSEYVQSSPQVTYQDKILFFGRLEKYKGVDVLLEAYRLYCTEYDGSERPALLVLAGSGSILDEQSMDLPPGVEWRNRYIKDVEALELFESCGLVVLPYIDATQTAIIPSAYFFSKPVLASRVGSFHEYVVDGKTGVLVDPGDPLSLADAMHRLFQNRSLLRTMGSAGREWYDKNRDHEFRSLKELYQQCLQK